MEKVITVAMVEREARAMLRKDMKYFKDDPSAKNFRLLVSAMRVYQDTFYPSEYQDIRKNGPDFTLPGLESLAIARKLQNPQR